MTINGGHSLSIFWTPIICWVLSLTLEINIWVTVSNNNRILCYVLGTLLNVCINAHIMSTCLVETSKQPYYVLNFYMRKEFREVNNLPKVTQLIIVMLGFEDGSGSVKLHSTLSHQTICFPPQSLAWRCSYLSSVHGIWAQIIRIKSRRG